MVSTADNDDESIRSTATPGVKSRQDIPLGDLGKSNVFTAPSHGQSRVHRGCSVERPCMQADGLTLKLDFVGTVLGWWRAMYGSGKAGRLHILHSSFTPSTVRIHVEGAQGDARRQVAPSLQALQVPLGHSSGPLCCIGSRTLAGLLSSGESQGARHRSSRATTRAVAMGTGLALV